MKEKRKNFTWFCEKNGIKYVRCFKKNKKEINAYPRLVPTIKIMELLKNTTVKYPAVLDKSFNYIDYEMIVGEQLTSNVYNKFISDSLINYFGSLNMVDCSSIYKYLKWHNNTSFLQFTIKHLMKFLDSKSQYHKVYDALGINKNLLIGYLNYPLDDQRKMTLIHGKLDRRHLILKDGILYLIDWETSLCADIAYELALHFSLMKYTEDEKEYMISNLCARQGFNYETLKRDINVYNLCEVFRRIIISISKIVDLYITNDQEYHTLMESAYQEYIQFLTLTGQSAAFTYNDFFNIIVTESKK